MEVVGSALRSPAREQPPAPPVPRLLAPAKPVPRLQALAKPVPRLLAPAPPVPRLLAPAPRLLARGPDVQSKTPAKRPVPSTSTEVVCVPAGPSIASVTLKYNHYTHNLLAVGGELETAVIDEQFSLRFGFRGNYVVSLRSLAATDAAAPRLPCTPAGHISGLVDGGVYQVEVDEDPTISHNSKPYVRAPAPTPVRGAGASVADLTRQLKLLDLADLAARTREFQDLVEARDLEDILFGPTID